MTTLREVDRHFCQLESLIKKIEGATSSVDQRSAWEEFLFAFGRTMGKIITLSLSVEASRPFGHRLKEASTKGDPGLVYLREARNVAEHGLEPFANFQPNTTYIGGRAIGLSGSGTASMRGNIINGVLDGNYDLKIIDGMPVRITGNPRVGIGFSPFYVQLIPVRNPEKKRTFPVPSMLDGQPLDEGSPIKLAAAAYVFINARRSELAKLLKL